MYSIKMHQRRNFSSKQAAVPEEEQLGPLLSKLQAICSIQHALVTKWVQEHRDIRQGKSREAPREGVPFALLI